MTFRFIFVKYKSAHATPCFKILIVFFLCRIKPDASTYYFFFFFLPTSLQLMQCYFLLLEKTYPPFILLLNHALLLGVIFLVLLGHRGLNQNVSSLTQQSLESPSLGSHGPLYLTSFVLAFISTVLLFLLTVS